MDQFVLVLGDAGSVLPGSVWTQYTVDVLEDKMVCAMKNDPSVVVEIPYATFRSAEFGIGSGNLWLQCELENGKLNFCSPRKCWKSEAGKKLVGNIDKISPIKDMKNYKQYTGPFFFLAMFK